MNLIVTAIICVFHWVSRTSDGKIDANYASALFSALAFAGVICALLVQIAEYHLAQDEREEALETQHKISTQQYFASVISAVSTWGQVKKVELPPWKHLRYIHIDYLGQQVINEATLTVATDYLFRQEVSDGKHDLIREFQNDRRLALARRDVDIAKRMAYIAMDHIFGASRFVFDSIPRGEGRFNREFPDIEWAKGLIISSLDAAFKQLEEYEWTPRPDKKGIIAPEDGNIGTLVINVWAELTEAKSIFLHKPLFTSLPKMEA